LIKTNNEQSVSISINLNLWKNYYCLWLY
jgi:hypothetical protein